MAGPAALLLGSLKPKGSGDSLPGESSEPGSKAAALKSMWANMKAGDFDAAALDFHDAYMACQDAEATEGADDSDAEMGEADEMEM